MGNNNQSLLAQQVRIDNFVPQLSGKIVTSGTSASFTFSPLTGVNRTTFKVTNKGSKGAYIAWGVNSAGPVTAIASSTTGNGAAGCDYIGAGAIITQDFQSINGVVDTIAAIQGADTQDNGSTTLEITIGFGQ